MRTAIESFIEKIKSDFQPIDEASDLMFDKENNVSMDWLANQSCLTVRQLIREV